MRTRKPVSFILLRVRSILFEHAIEPFFSFYVPAASCSDTKPSAFPILRVHRRNERHVNFSFRPLRVSALLQPDTNSSNFYHLSCLQHSIRTRNRAIFPILRVHRQGERHVFLSFRPLRVSAASNVGHANQHLSSSCVSAVSCSNTQSSLFSHSTCPSPERATR